MARRRRKTPRGVIGIVERNKELTALAGHKIGEYLLHLNNQIAELQEEARLVNEAWGKWDLHALQDIIGKRVAEGLQSTTPVATRYWGML